jgi:Uma2 family endonuclease
LTPAAAGRSVDDMATYPVRTRRWTRAEYDRLIAIGVFRADEPVELLGGELVVAEPQGSAHFTAVGLVEDALRAALGTGWLVRSQGPIALDDESEPEPDVAVAPGTRRDYAGAHPARPVLVVEVSDSSLGLDRDYKGSLYARAGLTDYWILNLAERVLEIYRQPVASAAARFGWRYASRERIEPDVSIAPLAAPGARIRVRDLLP